MNSTTSDYENVRVTRMKENMSVMESLGLKEGASIFKARLEKRPKKSKKKLAQVENENG